MTLIDIDPQLPDRLHRVAQGLYVPLTWQGVDMFNLDTHHWYQGRHEWPEYSGDVESRSKFLRDELENGTYIYEYGSCDSPDQFLVTETGRNIISSPWALLVTFRQLKKSDERDGGYRWHKNGPYLGVLKREGYEYLKDEPHIEEIWQFEVHRRRSETV